MSESGETQKNAGCSCGFGSITLGSFIAVLMSWTVNHSVIYAFCHGLFGWLYVIYWLFAHWKNHGGEIPW